MRVDGALAGYRRLFLDSAPVIYLVEAHPEFGAAAASVITLVERGGIRAVVSPVTLSEVLVLPMRQANSVLLHLYRERLCRGINTEFCPIGADEADQAARLRAKYRIALTDALQFAVAIRAGCDAFLTNDADLKRIQEIPVLVLSELEA